MRKHESGLGVEVGHAEADPADIDERSEGSAHREGQEEACKWDGRNLIEAIDNDELNFDHASRVLQQRAEFGYAKRKQRDRRDSCNNERDADAEAVTTEEQIRDMISKTQHDNLRCHEESAFGERSRVPTDEAVGPKRVDFARQVIGDDMNEESEKLIMETCNATYLNSNRPTALARKAHFQAVQEACLTDAQMAGMCSDAATSGKAYIGGPTDPEQGKAAAGVGALFLKDLAVYPIPKATDDYRDVEKSGRCKIVCFDAGGCTIVCAIVYGWTGASKGCKLAARTDDILAIIQVQFEALDPGPKIIMGDFNGSLDAFPTACALIDEHGWTDVGNDEGICQGRPGRATCHTNSDAKESRIDFIFTNERMMFSIPAGSGPLTSAIDEGC